MPHQEYLCSHTRTVEDDREGTIVCTECGLVLEDKLFLNGKDFSFSESPLPNLPLFEMKEEIKEILSKANLPESYVNKIPKALLKKSKKCIPYIVYKTLNDDGNPISLKEISAVSGISDSEIYNMQEKDKVIIIKPDLMIERFCTMLNLDFKSMSVIKKKVKDSINKSGHNPLTVIASNIYLYCKENNIKISLKKVAETLNISTISIQRYIKRLDNGIS